MLLKGKKERSGILLEMSEGYFGDDSGRLNH
jgi:hypothetical protein